MKTAYLKDSIRKLKSSIFQYISIILIIILGVAFFVGMNIISPNMEITAENYLKQNKAYDINLISTIGWEDKDVEIAKNSENIVLAEGAYMQDVIVESEDITLAVRLNSIPELEINKMDITEGREPEKNTECVIDTRMHTMYGYNIGDKIEIKSGTSDSIDDLVNIKEFEVVGIARNPIYLSQYYGITELETGELKAYLMVKKDVFKSEVYTSIYLKTDVDENLSLFQDKYKEKMEEIGPKILENLVPNTQDRCNTLFSEYSEEIEESKKKLSDAEKEYKDTEKQIIDAEEQVNELEAVWKGVKQQYQIDNILSPGSNTAISLEYINQMLETIKTNKEEVAKKRAEFDEQKSEYQQKIEDSKKELEDAQYTLDNFTVDIYQNNLTENESFISLKNDLVKIGMMGKVFPLMFFIVAALVTITTVSRTIEEERGNIGILKALGYGNFTIAVKFIIYAVLTTLIGTILGIIVGNTLIVQILYTSYSSLYALPELAKEINWPYTLMVIGISSISIIGVTLFITIKSLKEKASELMRPKSAKEGKNIFIEKMGFIWKHLNFFYKSSFRNIFRYKRRLIMAIIGIAGCTALIYTGFALKTSIDSIAIRQFSEIKTYDMEINLKEELPENKIEDILKSIEKQGDITSVTPVRQQSTTLWFNDKSKDLYYIVIDKKDVKDYINIKSRTTQEEVNLTNKGIIITEKLAKTFGIKVGDKVKIGDDVKLNEVKVIGIAENYLYNYIYMTPDLYKGAYEKELKYNQFFANTDDLSNDEMQDIAENLKENEKISGIMLTSNVNNEYQKSLNSLMSIVILCIGCASLLAFIVLVNLNIINIAERKRELATLKLLGFFDKEVSSYVFRENVILTIIGIFAGMIFGNFVLGIIIQSAEVETIMLPNELSIQACCFSAILTLAFTIITNFVMNPKIKRIDMIDSLKSVE